MVLSASVIVRFTGFSSIPLLVSFLIRTFSSIHTIFCRTFDVDDTGRISEPMFRQILTTKSVPQDDIDGMLDGRGLLCKESNI